MNSKNLSGKRIKLARTNREMAQADLCAALSEDHQIEMTQNTLSNIERGERIITDIELAAFSQIFNINPIWFLFGDHAPAFDTQALKS